MREKNNENEEMVVRKSINGWKTISAGDSAFQIIPNLSNDKKLELRKKLKQGYYLLTQGRLVNKIELGRTYDYLCNNFIMKNVKQIVNSFWCAAGKTFDDLERRLQEARQLYQFYNECKKFRKDIPVDSALSIMRHITTLPKNKRKKELKQINRSGSFRGVLITKTKKLREKLDEAREKYGKCPDDNYRLVEKEIRNYSYMISEEAAKYERKYYEILQLLPKNKKLPKNIREQAQNVSRNLVNARGTIKKILTVFKSIHINKMICIEETPIKSKERSVSNINILEEVEQRGYTF